MGGEEESKKVEEVEAPPPPVVAEEVPPAPGHVEAPKDVAEEKTIIPPAPSDEKVDDSKALAVVESDDGAYLQKVGSLQERLEIYTVIVMQGHPKQGQMNLHLDRGLSQATDAPTVEKSSSGGSIDRDAVLSRVATEKRMSLIKAWEESEKTKAENKAYKKLSAIGSWENTKKANIEAQLRSIEETLERKKAEYAEKMKNKIAIVHKEAEEKRAIVEAKRGEELLKAEEMAAKYRATGLSPKKIFGCFGP